MLKSLTGVAVAAAVAVGGIAGAPQQAEARGGAIAAGVIGGLAAGAIIGSAVASPYYYGPGPYYYGARPAYYGGGCWWRRVWGPHGWHRVRVCR